MTGGAGFIGSHLVERLLADGFAVTVLDKLATGSREYVAPEATLVEGDVSDGALVDELFASERFEAVFHTAGQASIRLSFAAPEADLSTNVVGTLNVVRGCLDSGVARLVNASSMTVYGEPELIPTPERVPCVPVSYYGVTKYAAGVPSSPTGIVGSSSLKIAMELKLNDCTTSSSAATADSTYPGKARMVRAMSASMPG